IGFVAARVVDSIRRVRAHFSDWSVWFHRPEVQSRSGEEIFQEPYDVPDEFTDSAGYTFETRVFSSKRSPVGLHKIAVEFTRGTSWFRTIVASDDAPGSRGFGEDGQLSEITIEPNRWTVFNVHGFVDTKGLDLTFITVWLTAETAAGKKYRWKVG